MADGQSSRIGPNSDTLGDTIRVFLIFRIRMHMPPLRNIELSALQSLAKQVRREIARREQAARRQMLDAIARELYAQGLRWEEAFDTPAPADFVPKQRGARAIVSTPMAVPKYRNPYNSTQTWSGRGRAPAWVSAHLSTGRSLDALLFQK